MNKIAYYPKFIRQFRKLPSDLKEETKEKIELFKQNRDNPTLKNHKLQGRLREYYSFSVNYVYRILYKIQDGKAVLMEIGTHDLYK